VRVADFEFYLPEELIAQHPTITRDASRLLVMRRGQTRLEHKTFRDVREIFRRGDVLVLNNSRVIPARLHAVNQKTGGAFEILLLEENALNDWWAMMRPGKRARVGSEIVLTNHRGEHTEISATVLATNEEGHRRLRFEERAANVPPATASEFNLSDALDTLGELPLPPYIRRAPHNQHEEDRARYQTVYARDNGSVAAPTAGLHFTEELLNEIRALGVEICHVTLHVGPGTFAPIKADRIEDHLMHHERFHVEIDVAEKINAAKAEGCRVIAVGTTSVRVLESVAREHDGKIIAGPGRTNIFIYPPYHFRIVDALVTNFHLPRSTLLMLVSAFAAPNATSGREKILAAYDEAVRERYRFFSYGDAMVIT
jgi:S-adenosylmethionine:tRNA ribosyltransferase-isomerase